MSIFFYIILGFIAGVLVRITLTLQEIRDETKASVKVQVERDASEEFERFFQRMRNSGGKG